MFHIKAIVNVINFQSHCRVDVVSGIGDDRKQDEIIASARRDAFRRQIGVKNISVIRSEYNSNIVQGALIHQIKWKQEYLQGIMTTPYITEYKEYMVWVSELGTICDRRGMKVDKYGKILTPYEYKSFFQKWSVFTPDKGEFERIGYVNPCR